MSNDAIIASDKGGGKDFDPCPEGPQRLVCCDVVDHGIVHSEKWGDQHKVTVVWQSEHLIKDGDAAGKPFLVQRRFTLSLHPKAELRKYLESWRGRQFTADEAAGFNLVKLIGANAYGNVQQFQKPRGLFAELIVIMPLPAGMVKLTVSPDYIRMKDRAPKPTAAGASTSPAETTQADDIPF